MKEKKCLVCRVKNLQVVRDGNNRAFQVFNAGDYQLVTGVHYKEDQLGIVIPANATVPEHILIEMWLNGKLAGAKRNKVRAKLMAGHMSEGLFYGQVWFMGDPSNTKQSLLWQESWKEGDDVTDQLGVTFE
jgi:hypothetical protein